MMVVLLLLYAYNVGMPSAGKIKNAWWEGTFRVLTGNQQPDRSCISDFCRRHLSALAGLFAKKLRL